mmetsp:Transcript_39133/g.80148  ORF Transcript_39133/g.80148 Transcript_39133/m.80148 type:complete len:431 (-) Transcript_39133:567-1859(-)
MGQSFSTQEQHREVTQVCPIEPTKSSPTQASTTCSKLLTPGVPRPLLCTLSRELMKDPVLVTKVTMAGLAVSVGDTVDYSALLEHCDWNKDAVEFVPNENIRDAIEEFNYKKTADSTPVDAVTDDSLPSAVSALLEHICRFGVDAGEVELARNYAAEPTRPNLRAMVALLARIKASGNMMRESTKGEAASLSLWPSSGGNRLCTVPISEHDSLDEERLHAAILRGAILQLTAFPDDFDIAYSSVADDDAAERVVIDKQGKRKLPLSSIADGKVWIVESRVKRQRGGPDMRTHELVRQWREEEGRFREWLGWVREGRTQVWESDQWMDDVAHFQELMVKRDLDNEAAHGRRNLSFSEALTRLRQAHLYYPGDVELAQGVQVQHNFVKTGCAEGEFVDVSLHDASNNTSILLSAAIAKCRSRFVLVVSGSSS